MKRGQTHGHTEKAGIQSSGLFDGKASAPRALGLFVIELIREVGFLHAAGQGGRAIIWRGQ